MNSSPEENPSAIPRARQVEANGALWVTVGTWTWLALVVVFSVHIVIERATPGSRLDAWGEPVDHVLAGLGTVSVLYLFLLPIASLTVVVANVIDLARNLEMGPVAQVVRMLTVVAAVAAPIMTFLVLRS